MITGSDNTPAYLTEDAWERTENSMLSGDQPDNVRMVEDKPSPYAFVGKPYTQTAIDRRLERAASMRAILMDIARTKVPDIEITAKVGISNGSRKKWRAKPEEQLLQEQQAAQAAEEDRRNHGN